MALELTAAVAVSSVANQTETSVAVPVPACSTSLVEPGLLRRVLGNVASVAVVRVLCKRRRNGGAVVQRLYAKRPVSRVSRLSFAE